jgi:hypothetical protein
MAPAADIVCVKADRHDRFADADVLDAMAFVFLAAGAHGVAAVENLSIGGQGGPHDGTSNTEVALAALMDAPVPGRAIVVAAGNDGAQDIHAAGFATGGHDFDMAVRVLPYVPRPEAPRGFVLTLFAPHDAALALRVTSPTGEEFGPVAAGAPVVSDVGSSGSVALTVCPDGPEIVGARSCEIGLSVRETKSTPVAEGVWQVRLAGESAGRVEGWLSSSLNGPLGTAHLIEGLDADDRVTSPGTSTGALTIASFISRAGWTRFDGMAVSFALTPGALSAFSGEGPGRGPARALFKPDLAAPGEWIVAALSTEAPPTSPASAFFSGAPPGSSVVPDLAHAALRGTSMATPHVTGAVALLFQENPWLTGAEVRALLRATAAADDFTGRELPDQRWGFGKLDVWNAVRVLRGDPPGELDAGASRVGTTLDLAAPGTDEAIDVYAIPVDASGLPLGGGRVVEIDASAGTWAGAVEERGFGIYMRTLLPPAEGAAAPGADLPATITARVDGFELAAHPVVHFALSRAAVGREDAVAGGGGCAVAGGGRRDGTAAGALLAALAATVAALCARPVARFRTRRATGRATGRARRRRGAGRDCVR